MRISEYVARLVFMNMQVYTEEFLFTNATENDFDLSTQKTAMKTISFLLLTIVFIIGCDKPIESDTQFTDLTIVQTSTPTTGTVNQNIVSAIKVSGPDLCYRFAYFTVHQQQFLVDIHAIGTYPTKPTACAMAIYYKDTTLSLQANAPGKYVLRFYNGAQLFKSDTVQVN